MSDTTSGTVPSSDSRSPGGEPPPVPRRVTLTDSAAKRVAFLLEQEERDGLFMRVSVQGGGCSGFQYSFAFDDHKTAEDHVFARDGVELVIDDVSLDLVAGSEVDFVQDLIGASFQIRNPNATSQCGCGNSFAI